MTNSTPKQPSKRTARKPSGVQPSFAAKVTSVKRVPKTSVKPRTPSVKELSRCTDDKKTRNSKVINFDSQQKTDILSQLTDWQKKDADIRKMSEKQGKSCDSLGFYDWKMSVL